MEIMGNTVENADILSYGNDRDIISNFRLKPNTLPFDFLLDPFPRDFDYFFSSRKLWLWREQQQQKNRAMKFLSLNNKNKTKQNLK